MNIRKRIIESIALTIITLGGVINASAKADFEFLKFNGKEIVADTVIIDTICHGENYTENGFNLINPDAGNHIDSANCIGYQGNDSTVYLDLYVGETYYDEYYEYICQGEEFHDHGFDVYEEDYVIGMNVWQHTEKTQYGCDSIAILKLMVGEVFNIEIDTTICYGENYYEHGFTYQRPEVGDYEDSLILKTGLNCDSILWLSLHVKPVYHFNYIDTICHGENYTEHGFRVIEPEIGIVNDSMMLTTTFGCDSTAKLKLYVMPTYDTLLEETICFGEVYDNHGFYHEDLPVGTKFDTMFLESIHGCDSTVRLELYVAPTYETLFTDTICHGESYEDHGFIIYDPAAGLDTFQRHLTTIHGCDSLVELHLYVGQLFDVQLFDTICSGESYQQYDFNIYRPEVGTHIESRELLTGAGCDSIVTLTLTVGQVYDTTINAMICYGESYNENNFHYDNPEPGRYLETLFFQTTNKCDSTVRLELYVAPTYETLFTDTICHGESYDEHGFIIYDPAIGLDTFQRHLTTIHGCDSLVELHLYVGQVFDVQLFDTICSGESYQQYHFNIYKPEVGMHIESQELLTDVGCDSIVTLTLTVGQIYDTTINAIICYGESYNENNFHYDNPEPGRYLETHPLHTTNKCDSIVRLDLYVAPTYSYDVYDSICEGEDYTKYGLEIINTEPGTDLYISQLSTIHGCDSIYNVTLKVIHAFEKPTEITGDSIVMISCDLCTGTYYYSIEKIPGCKKYEWSLWVYNNEGWEENTDWRLTYDNNECKVIVTTPIESMLKVKANNSCGEVEQSMILRGTYFDINEFKAVDATIYPNPFNDFVNVECKSIEIINLYNTSGQKVKSLTFNKEDKVVMDLGDLGDSLYLLEVITSEGRSVKQVSKTDFR